METYITFKLFHATVPEITLRRLRRILNVIEINCMYPDDENPQIACVYTMRIEPAAKEEVLSKLKQDPDVAYAYDPAPPKPMN